MPRSAGAWRAVCSSASQSVANSGGPPCAAGSRGGPHACASSRVIRRSHCYCEYYSATATAATTAAAATTTAARLGYRG
eukprot:scaffold67744_cov36-Phaeocystis_antarctica.AAC.3